MSIVRLFLLFSTLILCSNISLAQSKHKIGVIIPLSGPLAEYGVAMQNSISLATDSYPRLFKDIEFVYEDSKYNPKNTITSFRKLTKDKNLKFIITFGCPPSQAIIPLVDQAKIPTAMFCSSMLLTKSRKFSFGMTPPANEWANILWKKIKSLKPKKICMITTENDYLLSEFNALKEEVNKEKNGYSLIEIIDSYSPTDLDFRSSLLKLKSKSCDAVGVYLLPGQIRAFFKQVKNLNLQTNFFGTDTFESSEEILASQNGMENSIFVNLSTTKSFSDAYIKKYSNDNQIPTACTTHDLIVRVAKLINTDIINLDLMDSISKLDAQEFSCGISKFIKSTNGEQYFNFPLSLKTIKDNKIIEIK